MTDSHSTSPKKSVAKPRKNKAPALHPPVQQMVDTAIATLKERRGSSLAAIKKYIGANFNGVDTVRLAPFIRKYLKKAVLDGKLVQVKGTGASGSFKLSAAAKKEPKKKATVKKPKAKKEKTKKPKEKKSPAKKSKAKKTPAKGTKTKKVTKPKSPKKAKTATKSKKTVKPKAKKATGKKAAKPTKK